MVFLFGALVRRLHDRNRSGWWLLVFFGPHVLLVTALSQVPATMQQTAAFGLIGGFLVAPFMVWGMVEVFFLRGVNGENKYGADPLGSGDLPKSMAAHP